MKAWRRRTAVWPVAAATALLVALAWTAYAQGVVVLSRGHVAVPPDAAGPRAVVAAYIDALNAHDCDTVRRLVEDRTEAQRWCDDVFRLRHVKVADPFSEDPAWSGRQGQQVMNVGVTFDLDWRLFHDDGSMPEGRTTWSYLLVRDAVGKPWRIGDQGDG